MPRRRRTPVAVRIEIELAEGVTVSEVLEAMEREPLKPRFVVDLVKGDGNVALAQGDGIVKTIKGKASNIGYEEN